MLEGGSGQGGQGTAFDEITVGQFHLEWAREMLTKLQHIIIDEVHERTIESDFLLIVLKSLVVQRPSLRYVLKNENY